VKATENTAVNTQTQSTTDESKDSGSTRGTASKEINNSSAHSADERSEDSWDFVFQSAQ
jgi:hypothetical protein